MSQIEKIRSLEVPVKVWIAEADRTTERFKTARRDVPAADSGTRPGGV